MYTTLFTYPQRKNLGMLGRAILLDTQQVPLLYPFLPVDCSDVLVLAVWNALERHHAGTTFLCVSQGLSPPIAAEACSGRISGKQPHSNGLEWWQVPAGYIQEFHPRYLSWISPGELWWTLRADSRRPRCGCFCCWSSCILWKGLISKQDLCKKGRIHDAPLQKSLYKSNTRCEVVGPHPLYSLEVVCLEVLFLQDFQHWRLIWTRDMGNGTCASWGVVVNSLKHFSFKCRCPHLTRSSTNAPGTKRPIFSKTLIKASKPCVTRVISVWKPFLVHAESTSSFSASRPVTHHHVG